MQFYICNENLTLFIVSCEQRDNTCKQVKDAPVVTSIFEFDGGDVHTSLNN